LETAPFLEFTSVKITDAFNVTFDVEKIPEENLQSYCQNLICKIYQLRHSQIPNFISHHCNIAKYPMQWLNKFEKLIFVNEKLFHKDRKESRLIKFQTCIELKRNELKSGESTKSPSRPDKKQINAESEERYFSFKETKRKTEQMDSDKEKIYFLTSEIFDYRSADIEMRNEKLPCFDQECENYIEQIRTLSQLRFEMEKEEIGNLSENRTFRKMRINCNLNQIVDVYYQLHYELFVEGKPFIDGSKSDLIDIICNSFNDKDGNEISPATVETILRPSKYEKRPKSHKRIDLEKLL
jgi:hypothetical protein